MKDSALVDRLSDVDRGVSPLLYGRKVSATRVPDGALGLGSAVAIGLDGGYGAGADSDSGGVVASSVGACGADNGVIGEVKGTSFSRSSLVAIVGGLTLLLVVAFAAAWQAAIWPLNQQSEKALVRRAQLYWDSQVSGDSLGAYELMMETYRRRVDPSGFVKSNGIVVVSDAQVKGVTLDEKGGLVDVELKYHLAKGKLSELTSTTQVRERWVIEDGRWYRWPPQMGG